MTAAAIRTSSQPRVGTRRPAAALLGAAGLAGLISLLELVPRLGLVNRAYLPPFSEMIAALTDQLATGAFWDALASTMTGWAIGLGISMVAGVALGILIGSIPFVRAATSSTIEFLRPIPSVALIPLAVVLFGTEMTSTLLLVVYASFWQVLVQVL